MDQLLKLGASALANGQLNVNQNQAAEQAAQQTNGVDKSAFETGIASAIKMFTEKNTQHNVDQQEAEAAEKQIYGGSGEPKADGLGANALGGAAALHIFKSLMGGDGQQQQQQQQEGGFINKLISKAMAEAIKIFTNSSNTQGGQQDVINSAASMAMKLLLQQQLGGSSGGGSSGGAGQLLGLASQFLK